MERGYANLICENPLLTTLSEDYYYFGNSSRCFNIYKDDEIIPACYKA
jgi:hypothetical protein